MTPSPFIPATPTTPPCAALGCFPGPDGCLYCGEALSEPPSGHQDASTPTASGAWRARCTCGWVKSTVSHRRFAAQLSVASHTRTARQQTSTEAV